MYQDSACEAQGMIQKAAYGGGQIGAYIPPTKRQQLEQKRSVLEAELEKVNAAISALDAHPDLEQFIDTIERAR